MPHSRIDDLLERQAADLASLEDRELRRILRAYDDARRDLRERLGALDRHGQTPATAQHVRVMLAQAKEGGRILRERLGEAFSAAERAVHGRALANLVGLVKRAEPHFVDTGALVELRILRRLAENRGLALHRYSIDRYGSQVVEAIQRQIVAGVVQGLTQRELANRIAGAGQSAFAGMRHRAALITRMELARAYDAGAQASLEEFADTDEPDTDDPLLKKADEYLDRRNHPLSRALHGQVQRPRDPFEVPVAAVGSTRGIVWAIDGGVIHGMGYPAHFNDRGRQIPWRMSWEGKRYAPAPSLPAKPLSRGDWTALRALGRGEEPTRLTTPGRARLQQHRFAGVNRGRLAIYPEGRDALAQRRARPAGTTPLRREEDRIRRRPEEHLAVLLSDGRLFRSDPAYTRSVGGPAVDPRRFCAVRPEAANAAIADGNAVITHNHPSGSPLSHADMLLAQRLNLAEIRAVLSQGGAWRLRRPADGWPDATTLEREGRRWQDQAALRAVERMNAHVESAGGDPRHGTKAKGYSDALWTRIYSEEVGVAQRELRRIGLVVERER